MTSPGGFPAAAAESVDRSLSDICRPDDAGDDLPWDPPRRFHGYAQRLRLLLAQLLRSTPPQDLSAPSAHTALRGMDADLAKAAVAFSAYRSKSRIYVLIHCKPLCSSLQDPAASIGNWLALLLDTPLLFSNPDIRKKAVDLSLDMQRANLRVTENEERVYCTLQKEGELRQSSKAVQSAIIMDLARALGMDAGDRDGLAEEIRLLKRDLAGSSSVAERRILISLEKTFDSWSAEPYVAGRCFWDADAEEDAHFPPFKNFLCPLTKEVMKEPVALENFQTYERTAITYWFNRCLEDGRDPTCPVTGQVLKTLELKPNIGLAGAIEEWVNRNIDGQVDAASKYLAEEGSLPAGCIERALDSVYRISQEHPTSRYKVRNAGLIVLIVKLLKRQGKTIGSLLRGKALMVLHSMSRDEESKLMMLQEGITRMAIRSLTSSMEEEKEFAAKLLLQFSYCKDYCAKLASEKGALVLLSSMAGNSEHPILSNLAEEILKNMEKVEDNIQHLAAAGRFQPLLARLCSGVEDVKLDVASFLGRMALGNNDKEHIARKGGRVLVSMLSSNLEGQTASLQALHNLSALDDNATILVDFGALPALINILFKHGQDEPPSLKELAASTIANIVSKSGHWELASVDRQGNRMQSECIVHGLLELLEVSSSKCQLAVLQTLHGIASSPQASDLAATHVRSGNGIATIVPFLEHSEMETQIYAFRLVSLLSERLGQLLADELIASNKLPLLREKLLDAQSSNEKSEVAATLANLPIPDEVVKTTLGTDLLRWAVSSLNEQRSNSLKNSRHTTSMAEGLLGILLHFARSSDPAIMSAVCENQLTAVFREHLSGRSSPREKQRAALGLKYLSASATTLALTRELEPQPHGFCGPFIFMCCKSSMTPVLCPIHNVSCEDENSFCLLKGNSVKPLIDLMNDENTQVQIAVVETLSTLVSDAQSLKNATDELEELGLFDAAIDLFKQVRPGELQERVIRMIEKFSRVETLIQAYSTDQDLVRALIEALKHGNPNTKRHAQDALTNLRQLSGVGGKNSNHGRPRRTGH